MQQLQIDITPESKGAARLRVDVRRRGTSDTTELASAVRRGLGAKPKRLDAKYLYDERGSELFDKICDTPEYYPTRTEHALLRRVAQDLVRRVRPTDIVELGSGTSRKTRSLLDAVERLGMSARYVPFDVSESVIRSSARALLDEYDWLQIHGVVGDYEQDFAAIPGGEQRLILFIGSTIGNFESEDAVRFLREIAATMGPDDRFLLGTDLVKDHSVLNAAYNDAEGITREFNKNVLRMLNRELDADFDLDRFEHVARFEPEKSQIEMHLRARQPLCVDFGQLGWSVEFSAGETMRTEISRKFTRDSVHQMLTEAGLTPLEWYVDDDAYFGLSLSKRRLAAGAALR